MGPVRESGRAGLVGWGSFDQFGSGRVGSVWFGLARFGSDWLGLVWFGPDSFGLGWAGLGMGWAWAGFVVTAYFDSTTSTYLRTIEVLNRHNV